MYPGSPSRDKWLVYTAGCAVFVGLFYCVLRWLVGLSAGISLAAAIPGGVVGFFVFAMIAENWESGGWDGGA